MSTDRQWRKNEKLNNLNCNLDFPSMCWHISIKHNWIKDIRHKYKFALIISKQKFQSAFTKRSRNELSSFGVLVEPIETNSIAVKFSNAFKSNGCLRVNGYMRIEWDLSGRYQVHNWNWNGVSNGFWCWLV